MSQLKKLIDDLKHVGCIEDFEFMRHDEFKENLLLVIFHPPPKLPFLCTFCEQHTVFLPLTVPTTQAQTFERVY